MYLMFYSVLKLYVKGTLSYSNKVKKKIKHVFCGDYEKGGRYKAFLQIGYYSENKFKYCGDTHFKTMLIFVKLAAELLALCYDCRN